MVETYCLKKPITVYHFEMEKYVHVHLIGAKDPVIIKADSVEVRDLVVLVVKSGTTEVGEFKRTQVAGWSIHDLDD